MRSSRSRVRNDLDRHALALRSLFCLTLSRSHALTRATRFVRSPGEIVAMTSSTQDVASRVGVLEANTSDDASLQRMASQAVVCINAVGPFRFHGRQVVRACIEAGCSYLDICGEPEFIEAVAYEYEIWNRPTCARSLRAPTLSRSHSLARSLALRATHSARSPGTTIWRGNGGCMWRRRVASTAFRWTSATRSW